jgi:hypothetical protein
MHLKVKPGSISYRTQGLNSSCELSASHFRQLVVIDNRPTTGGLTCNNVTGSWLTEPLSVNAPI